MKKLSLLLVFSLVFLFSITAQEKKDMFTSDSTYNNGKNWFIGAGVQGDVYLNNNAKTDFGGVLARPSLAGNLFVGKWFSHKVGARIFGEGGTLHPFFENRAWMEDEKYLGGRVDFMLNLTNVFRKFSPDRFYNLVLYLGPGYMQSFNAGSRYSSEERPDGAKGSGSFMVGGGVLNTFRLSNHVSLFANVGLNVADANEDGYKGNSPSLFGSPNYFDGILSGSIGLIYNFGKSSKKVIVAPPVVQEQPAPKPEPKPEPRPQPKPEPKPEPPVVEPVKPVLNNVFFRLDKSIIDPDQEANVKSAADFLNANPNAKLNVVGYADVQTGNPRYNMGLSQRRTKAVAKELVTKYKIDSSRLKLDWKGDTVQPFAVNDKNRVVMFAE